MIGPFSPARRLPHRTYVLCLLAAAAWLTGGGTPFLVAFGQDSPSPGPTSIAIPAGAGEPSTDGSPTPGSESAAELETRVRDLVDGLRSDQFLLREQNSEQLFQLGHGTLPILRSIRRQSTDAEQSDRLDRIIQSLAQQDLESRIRSFLKGGESQLENWSEMESWFGDSPRIREIFVDLYREHPYLVESLNGSPQQLSMGLSRVRRRLIERGVGPRETPQQVDLIALLLPMTKPDYQAGAQYDSIVASLLQLYPAGDFQNDTVFGVPFLRMVSTWMSKSDPGLREPILRLALQWKMDIGLSLALETMQQNPDPIVLCRCMQTIARQGTRAHASLLAAHINDPTVVYQKRYIGTFGSDVQVGDVAAACIACLYSVPVMQIGFSEPAEHPVFGIIYEELAVPYKQLPEDGDPNSQESDRQETDRQETDNPESPDDEPALEVELDFQIDPDGRGLPPRSLKELARLRELIKRREAARAEIHLKALELLPAAAADATKAG